MTKILKFIFFLVIVRLLVLMIIGLRIAHKERLPKTGPAIIVANHNSHLDTLVLMTLFPLKALNQLCPVAAEDYFFRTPFLAWFSQYIIGAIPLKRTIEHEKCHPLKRCFDALENDKILIIYPEGSRGDPELLTQFKSGVTSLVKHYPTVPVYPIFLHGLGKSLPKGEVLLVPFFCDVLIGHPLYWQGNKTEFMETLKQAMEVLASEGNFPLWE